MCIRDRNTIAVHEQTDAYIAMPQLPYLPDAEPVSYTHLELQYELK